MKTSWIHRLQILLFMILIGVAFPLWSVVGGYFETENKENREWVERPVFRWETRNSYPKDFENFLNDHVPFRNLLIEISSLIDYYVFHTSDSESVVLGKDGWLFYNDEESDSAIRAYKGENLLSEEMLKKIADNMQHTKDHLAEEGTEFILLIVPNKEVVYSRYMPDYYGLPADEYGAKQIVDYLKKNTDVRVLYPIDELREAAKTEEFIIYRKTDSHWNKLGAYVAVRSLMQEMGKEILDWRREEFEIRRSDDVPGDLAYFLNLDAVIDCGEIFEPANPLSVRVSCEEYNLDAVTRFHAECTDPRKILIRHDSFGPAMYEPVSVEFAETVFINKYVFQGEMFQDEDADVFVLETVERFAPWQLSGFAY